MVGGVSDLKPKLSVTKHVLAGRTLSFHPESLQHNSIATLFPERVHHTTHTHTHGRTRGLVTSRLLSRLLNMGSCRVAREQVTAQRSMGSIWSEYMPRKTQLLSLPLMKSPHGRHQ